MPLYEIIRSDGGVTIMQVVDGADVKTCIKQRAESWRLSHERKTARGEASVLWEPVSYREISLGEVPQDRTFREAWIPRGRVDMPKATQIARDRVRAARAARLTALDAEFTRAQGQGKAAEAAAVEAKRQALRDAPADPRLAAAADPDALKAAMTTVIAEMQT